MAKSSGMLANDTDTCHGLSLILPTLDEQESIVEMVHRIFQTLPHLGELLIVDDSPTNLIADLLTEHFWKRVRSEQIRILRREKVPCLIDSLRLGISEAKCELIGWMDADLSMPPEMLLQMIHKIALGADVCVASRFLKEGKQKSLFDAKKDHRLQIALSSAGNWFLSRWYKTQLTDFTSGFIVGKASVLKRVSLRGKYLEYFPYLLVELLLSGVCVNEVPYEAISRKYGRSKTATSLTALLGHSTRSAAAILSLVRAGYAWPQTASFFRR